MREPAAGRGNHLAPALAAALGVAVLLLAPLPLPSGGPAEIFGVPYLDKLAHLVVFLALGWIWRRSLVRSGRPVPYFAVFVAVVCYGGLLELLQGASGVRTAEWGDLAAAALGAGLVPLWGGALFQPRRTGSAGATGPLDSR
jgi:VanZ family protein